MEVLTPESAGWMMQGRMKEAPPKPDSLEAKNHSAAI